MGVRLGINPIGWTNDDLRWLGDEIPLEVCLAEARLAGFTGIELGRKFPRRAAALRPILEKHGLALVSGWYSAKLLERDAATEIAALEEHLVLLAEMNCRVLVFAEASGDIVPRIDVGLSQRPRITAAADWRKLGERLTAVAEHVLGRGIRRALHHHMGTPVQTEEDVDRLLEHCGEAVGLLVDTGHLVYAGGDPIRLARKHAHRVAHVHCKDLRRGALESVLARDASFAEAVLAGVFTVPGDGHIDFPRFVETLSQIGYSGWIVCEAEQDPRVAHPLSYARMGHRTLTQACQMAGLSIP